MKKKESGNAKSSTSNLAGGKPLTKIRTEMWEGHPIRFVEKEREWWAIAKDVAEALDFRDAFNATSKVPDQYKGTAKVSISSDKAKAPDTRDMTILTEKGVYRLIMRSNKPEALAFQDWVYDVLKAIRQAAQKENSPTAAQLEGFEVFCVLDKEHQKDAMAKLQTGLSDAIPINYIKANSIADKAVSNLHGYPKMLKKSQMTPQMLVDREKILSDTVDLMRDKERYELDISVSTAIYRKYLPTPSPLQTR